MAKQEFTECTLCGHDLCWDAYELRCVNCGSKHGTRDTAHLATDSQAMRQFYAALRDAWEVLILDYLVDVSEEQSLSELAINTYYDAKDKVEEYDMLAQGTTEHDQQWIYDALKRYGVERRING